MYKTAVPDCLKGPGTAVDKVLANKNTEGHKANKLASNHLSLNQGKSTNRILCSCFYRKDEQRLEKHPTVGTN